MASKKPEYTPGMKVGVRVGGKVRVATVTEDRGVFTSGRRVVRIRLGELDDPDAPEYEVRAEELEPLPAAA